MRTPDWLRRAFAARLGQRAAIVALLVAINGIVAWNAVHHSPRIQYDAGRHMDYFRVLAEGRLPTPADTHEYFSAPLPYVVPALAMRAGASSPLAAAKIAQILQVLLSVAACLGLLLLCDDARPGDGTAKLAALGLCAMAAVYYKTFAFTRGEPYIAAIAPFAAYECLRAIVARRATLGRSIGLGVLCGLLVLARQWGILAVAGFALFGLLVAARRPSLARAATATVAGSTIVAALVAGWFYAHLTLRYGSPAAFNLSRQPFSLANQPREFYFGTGSGHLFSTPGRPSFPNQLLPIFYADWWGDYWYYFLVGECDQRGSCRHGSVLEAAILAGEFLPTSDHASIMAYLGRVNLFALLPSLLMAAGFVLGLGEAVKLSRGGVLDLRRATLALASVVVLTTLTGFLWFLVEYPKLGEGDTIKAVYMAQIAPFLALLGAEVLVRIGERSRAAMRVLAWALALVAAHGTGTFFSRWPS